MVALRRNRGKTVRSVRRTGLLAIGELVVMAVVLTGLAWAAAQFMATMTNTSSSALTSTDNCSDRCVTRISLSHNGRRLWVYRRRHGVVQLDLQSGDSEQTLPVSGMDITALAHGRDNSTTLVCGADGTVVMIHDENAVAMICSFPDDMIVDASVSHDGRTAACATSKGRVLGWIRNGAETKDFRYDLPVESTVTQMALSGDGRYLFVGCHDGTVTFHNSVTGERFGSQLIVGERCAKFAWSDDERLIVAVTASGLIRVYDIEERRLVCESMADLSCSLSKVRSLQIAPDGKRYAVSMDTSKDICIFNTATGRIEGRLRGHTGIVHTLQFSPASDRLYSGGFDGTIREWSLETFSQMRVVN